MTFRERLKTARQAAKINGAEIAAALGISKSGYFGYEIPSEGQIPSVVRAAAMAKIVNVSLDYLGGLTDDPTPHWSVDAAPVKKSPADEAAAEMTTAPGMTPAEIAGRIERIERALKDAGITF